MREFGELGNFEEILVRYEKILRKSLRTFVGAS